MAGVSVEKRGNTWRYRFDTAKVSGKRTRVQKGGFATKREAQAAGAAALAEYNNCGLVFEPNEISYADYLDYWMEEYCKINLKAGTINMYRQLIDQHIIPSLGAYSLPQLATPAMQGVINRMFNDGYARSVLQQIKSIMKLSLEYAAGPAKFIRESPAVYLSLPKYNAEPDTPTRSNPHIYVAADQMALLFKRFPLGSNAHIPLLLGYRCGMRKGEAYGVAVEDIDFKNGTISIRQQLQRDYAKKVWYITRPKYNSVRTIDVDEDTLSVLAWKVARIEAKKSQLGDSYLRFYLNEKGYVQTEKTDREFHFLTVTDNGKFLVPEVVTYIASVARDELRIEGFDFHSLRHTHSTMLIEKGAPFKYVQERLGHKTIDTTLAIYQKVSPEITRQGSDVLSALFKSAG